MKLHLVKATKRHLLVAAVVGFIGFSAPAAQSAGDRPNILWLVSEDNDTFLGLLRRPAGPYADARRLARQGVLYERCFAEPVCAPSRFTLITGMYAVTCGPAEHMRAQGKIPSWLKGFPACLREAGYYTSNNAKTDYNSPISIKEAWDACEQQGPLAQAARGEQPFFSVFNHEVTHESCLFPDEELPLRFPARSTRPGCAFRPTSPTRPRCAPTGPATTTT